MSIAIKKVILFSKVQHERELNCESFVWLTIQAIMFAIFVIMQVIKKINFHSKVVRFVRIQFVVASKVSIRFVE